MSRALGAGCKSGRSRGADRAIRTHYDPPPIPLRQFDWTAVLENDDFEGMLVGYGATEGEARADLLQKIEEREE